MMVDFVKGGTQELVRARGGGGRKELRSNPSVALSWQLGGDS